MSAIFKVHQTSVFGSRSLFMITGEITQGVVRPGMDIHVSISDGLVMDLPIEGVDLLGGEAGESVALAVALEDESDADFLQQFDIAGESFSVSDRAR